MTDKEHIAELLRRHVSPSVVMAEVRLREVVNGSPGSIVQVRHDDLRELLREYRRIATQRSVADPPAVDIDARRWQPATHASDLPEYVGGCPECEYSTVHRHG